MKKPLSQYILRDPTMICFIIFLVISCSIILLFPNQISSDQSFIKYKFSFKFYPYLTDGIITFLIVGLYNLFLNPPLEHLNTHIRILAMIGYTGAAFLLAKALLFQRKWIFVFLVLLFTSRYPFLWLSRELIIGIFLTLAILGFIKKWNPFWVCLLIVFLGHTKPELLLVSLVFFIFLLRGHWKDQKLSLKLLAVYMGLNILLVIPSMLTPQGDWGSKRSFVSFGQHYAALVNKHQISPIDNPFLDYDHFTKAIFSKAENMKEIIFQYPKQYYDFLCLSLGHGIKRMIVVFNVLLFFIFLIYRSIINGTYNIDLLGRLFFISLIGCIPLVLFSFPHIRYLARYYPIAILVILSYVQQVHLINRQQNLTCGFLIIGGLIVNILFFMNSLTHLSSKIYWFPD